MTPTPLSDKRTDAAARRRRVFIVDDHPVVRMGLRDVIDAEPDFMICGEASDAASALHDVPPANPDLALIDISLPGESGLDLIEALRANEMAFPILAVSMHEDTYYAERALRAGAQGYVNKGEATPVLLGAMRSVLEGRVHLAPSVANASLHRLCGTSGKRGSALGSLTNREIEVCELVAAGATTREIATRLGRSVKTIETHRENIKAKLGLHNSAQLAAMAVRLSVEMRAGRERIPSKRNADPY
jgi:DNA-binding NarL/FixJ family response regulator